MSNFERFLFVGFTLTAILSGFVVPLVNLEHSYFFFLSHSFAHLLERLPPSSPFCLAASHKAL